MSKLRWKRRLRSARHALIALVTRAALGLFSLLPERILVPLAAFLGRRLALPFVAGTAMAQITTFMPELGLEEARGVVRRMGRNLGLLVSELILSRREGAAFCARMVRADTSRAYIEEARARGKGVIVLTAHFGNWELVARWGAQIYRAPLAVIGKRIRNSGLDNLVTEFRKQAGLEVIDRDDSPRRMLRHLAGGGFLGIVPDQDVDVLAGQFLPFFGRPAYTSTGPASLSIASGAPIVPVFLVREGGGFRLECRPPIIPDPDAPRREEVSRITKAWSEEVESMIRKHPDHWTWFHRRWASTPETVERKRARYLRRRQGVT